MGREILGTIDFKPRVLAFLGTAIFLIVGPGTVAGYVPWRVGAWRVHTPFFGFTVLRVMGGFLICAGAVLLIETFLRFALQGIGTPAPIFPTKHLVVTGSYRFVRNPMYLAVVSFILGQSFIFGDIRVLVYGLLVWLGFHLFIFIYEEPTLRRSFPQEYAVFSNQVPRWIPRLKPWHERS
jgi:protein-S-isoprenylcysteine O-methyltransferase Ste14